MKHRFYCRNAGPILSGGDDVSEQHREEYKEVYENNPDQIIPPKVVGDAAHVETD